MRTCPKCSHPAKAGNVFCGKCGTPLPPEAPRKPVAADPYIGKTLGERFLIEESLGTGAFGTVYLGTHVVLDRRVAVKLLHPSLLRDPAQLRRFYREALSAGAMNHPNLVGVLDCGEADDGAPFLVMEFIEGVNLEEALEAEPQGLSPGRALDITLQVARALRHVHERGVVHRDIKPSNIMLTVRDGEPEWAVVLDFGIAKVLASPMTNPGEVLGTPGFIAPEYLLSGECGPPADLYALGATLFEALTGRPLFDGLTQAQIMGQQLTGTPPTLRQVRPELDPRSAAPIDALLSRMVAREPQARPGAAETVSALEALRAQLPRRSEQGQVLARTVLLVAQEPSLHDARTALLPPRPTAADLSARRTRLLKDLLSVDQLCARLAQVSASLWAEVLELGPGLPEAARPLVQQVQDLDAEEDDLGVELAMVRERIREAQSRTSAERQALQVQVLDVTGAMSVRPGAPALPAAQREALSARRIELERRIQDLGRQHDLERHADRFDLLARLSRAQRRRRQALLQIGQVLLSSHLGPATQRRVEELTEEMGDTLTLLARHEERT